MTARSDSPQRPWAAKKAAARVLSPDETWAAEIRERVLEDCHPWQRDAVLDPATRISKLVGRGGGKTTTDRARAIIKLTSIRKARMVYVATTRPQAEELMWMPLKDSIEFYGLTNEFTFNESKLRCICNRTGSMYRLVGADDKKDIEKLRGQPFDEVQIDEGASYDAQLLENLIDRILGPRMGERNGVIVLSGTPGHILRGPFYDATRTASSMHRPYSQRDEFPGWDNWSSHSWSLRDVAELEDAKEFYPALVNLWREALREKERKAWTDDNPIWMREYLGKWAADDTDMVFRYRPHVDGQPWNQWDPERIGPMKFGKLPDDRKDWHHVVQMDQGYKDPFACNVFSFSPSDPLRQILHTFCFEKTEMHAKPVAELILGEDAVAAILAGKGMPAKLGGIFGQLGEWPDGIGLDGDDAFIAELANVYGIRVVKSDRKPDAKFGRIELVNGDLVDGRIKILKGSPLEQQIMELQWKEDDFGKRKEDKAQANHSTDTLADGRKLISNLFESGTVVQEKGGAPAKYVDPQGLDSGEISGSGGDEFSSLLADPFYDSWGNG